MKIYDLDVDEKFDIIKIWKREYEIWDVPVWIFERIQKINTSFITDNKLFEKWRWIIIDMLEVRNKDVDISKLRESHILQIIKIISDKIKNQDDYKKQI